MAVRINWLFKGLLVVVLVAAAVPAVFFLMIIFEPRPDYDDDDPRHAMIVDQLSRARDALDYYSSGPQAIDLASLNGGDWTGACLYGGYNDPLTHMRDLQANITPQDEERLKDLNHGFRLNQVEEFEAIVAFIDTANTAHLIHFKHGLGPEGSISAAVSSSRKRSSRSAVLAEDDFPSTEVDC